MVKLSVEEFLCGHWLVEAGQGILRGQLLQQLVTLSDVIEDWPAVLSVCCRDTCCQEAVLSAIHHGCAGAKQWAELNFKDISLPLNFRLRMAAAADIDCGIEAEMALLKGQPLAPEVMQLVNVRKLWPRVVAEGFVVPAAALLHAHPDACNDSEEVTSLAVHGLLGPSAEAKAAVAMLSSLRGADSVVLISGLIQKQPLHLLQSLPLPEQALHLTAASLALRHSDRRVAALLLPKLSGGVLLQEVVEAAARGEAWIVDRWWLEAAIQEITGRVEQLITLMKARPWSSMTLLDTLVSTWLMAYQAQAAIPFNGPDAIEALQSLRLDLPKRAESLAQCLSHVDVKDSRLLLEIACCGDIQVVGLDTLLDSCSRAKLKELVAAQPCYSRGLTRTASTALWALKNIPRTSLELEEGGFQLLHMPALPTTMAPARCERVEDEERWIDIK